MRSIAAKATTAARTQLTSPACSSISSPDDRHQRQVLGPRQPAHAKPRAPQQSGVLGVDAVADAGDLFLVGRVGEAPARFELGVGEQSPVAPRDGVEEAHELAHVVVEDLAHHAAGVVGEALARVRAPPRSPSSAAPTSAAPKAT